MKIYPIVCPSCKGGGRLLQTDAGIFSACTKTCPACLGSGVIECYDAEPWELLND